MRVSNILNDISKVKTSDQSAAQRSSHIQYDNSRDSRAEIDEPSKKPASTHNLLHKSLHGS